MKSLLIWLFSMQDLIDAANAVVKRYNEVFIGDTKLKSEIETLKKELNEFEK